MHERMTLQGVWVVEKYEDERAFRARRPYEIGKPFKNIMVTVGLQALGRLLTNQGAVTPFSNANAHIGVGNGTGAVAVGDTDLSGASKLRNPMVATYPTDPTGGVWVFRSDFASGDANFAWEEFGVFNAAAAGIMLNHALSTQGTKTAGQIWTATATITAT
jgi:hypothetical protein